MANSSPQLKLDPYPYATIVWKGETDYSQQLLATVEQQSTLFRRALVALQDSAQVLTPAEAETLKPRVEILIRDDRASKSVPLPAPPEQNATPEQHGIIVVRTYFTKPID